MGKEILILNGPNINLLGTREPEIYGHETLADIEIQCVEYAASLGLHATCFQTNNEGEMIDYIHKSVKNIQAIIINAGGWTHTSVALRDALLGTPVKQLIEVHISNIFAREEFRHFSYISDIATGVICGLGTQGYFSAIKAISNKIQDD
ncbi:MAG: type II 3-dehydroquinate dehydratase [Alphaproteobacteria bacterium]